MFEFLLSFSLYPSCALPTYRLFCFHNQSFILNMLVSKCMQRKQEQDAFEDAIDEPCLYNDDDSEFFEEMMDLNNIRKGEVRA